MVLDRGVPAVERIKPYRLKREFASAWRIEVKRPDGVTFVRSATPSRSHIGFMVIQLGTWTFVEANTLWQLRAAVRDDALGMSIYYTFGALMFVLFIGSTLRRLVRRKRAEAQGRWPYGVTVWPDRLISFVSDAEAIVAPRAAIDGVTVEDDGTISVQSTNAYGTTTTTKLGVFSGEPDALRRLLDGWFASSRVAA